MDLKSALYKSITRGRAHSTEGGSVARMMDEIQRAAGGRPSAAAALAGIPGRTWRGWRAGRRPTARSLARLQDAQRRVRLSAGREKFLRGQPAIAVWAEVEISADVRERVLRVSTWPDDSTTPLPLRINGMMRRVLDAWLTRDDSAAEDAFLAPIRHHLGMQGVYLRDVYEIRYFKRESEAEMWARTTMIGGPR